jgi:hypothetical protein
MPRYLVERAFDPCTQDELDTVVVRSKRLLTDDFRDVTWEHSHVCADEDGNVTSFCVYDAPDEGRVREHADQLGSHTIIRVIEIAGDIDPADIAV